MYHLEQQEKSFTYILSPRYDLLVVHGSVNNCVRS